MENASVIVVKNDILYVVDENMIRVYSIYGHDIFEIKKSK